LRVATRSAEYLKLRRRCVPPQLVVSFEIRPAIAYSQTVLPSRCRSLLIHEPSLNPVCGTWKPSYNIKSDRKPFRLQRVFSNFVLLCSAFSLSPLCHSIVRDYIPNTLCPRFYGPWTLQLRLCNPCRHHRSQVHLSRPRNSTFKSCLTRTNHLPNAP